MGKTIRVEELVRSSGDGETVASRSSEKLIAFVGQSRKRTLRLDRRKEGRERNHAEGRGTNKGRVDTTRREKYR